MGAILIGWLAAAMTAADGATAAPLEVRVGLLAYEDSRQEMERYSQLFARVAKASRPPVQFRLAPGTYGDLVHWLDRGEIDVAVVTPGVFAEGLVAGPGQAQRPYRYVATVRLPPARSPLASEDRRRPGSHSHYHCLCLVARESPLTSVEDLREAAKTGALRVLFVDPLSASGHVAPEAALRQAGVPLAAGQMAYTWSHSNSLRRLLDEPSAVQAAFVWDDAAAGSDAWNRVRQVPFPELDTLEIPQDVVIARAGFEHAGLVQSLLTSLCPEDFHQAPGAMDRYRQLRAWTAEAGLPADQSAAQRVSLDDIGAMLIHYARSHPLPPRLALVLSGGGAKCSYQVGAVAAIEERLGELRRMHPEPGLDIAMVVGTSGGAINAVPVALGIARTPEGQADFRRTWMELDQRVIVSPGRLVRANIGLWFAVVQVLLVLRWVNRGYGRRIAQLLRRSPLPPLEIGDTAADADDRWARCSRAMLALGMVEIAIGYLPWAPWRFLGENHALHHAWLWATLGVHWSAWCLTLVGVAGLAVGRFRPQWKARFLLPRQWTRKAPWALLLGLPLLQILTVLFYEETLSGGQGMEHSLAEKFPKLIDSHLARQGLDPLAIDRGLTDAGRMEAAGREIVRRGLLQRDLVLTGACLEGPAGKLPGDLYFYAAADPAQAPPPFGPRGVSLAERPSIFFDVVMGSGTIYPIFPPRTLRDFPAPGQQVDLIDGGFAHNSPVEAAVLWGATHVVLIQATPEEPRLRRNFAENTATAFNYLYDQTQRADARSKEEVVVFTLTPQNPHMCVIDFADNLVERGIAKGYREAGGSSPGRRTGPGFRKELGKPVFGEPLAATGGP